MGQDEEVRRARARIRLDDQLVEVLVVGLSGHRLDVANLLGFDEKLAQQELAPENLNQQRAVGLAGEMPVEVLVVVEDGVHGPRPQDAVGMGVEPSPECVERHRKRSFHGVDVNSPS